MTPSNQATLITAAPQDPRLAPADPRGTSRRLLEPGDTIAGYELLRRVKSGGMGALWVGRRSGVGGFAKHVAIKVIHPHLGENQDFVRMFLDEARLTARIHHPNVIQVYDVGLEHGSYFMVMELVTGCSIADISTLLATQRRRLTPAIAVAIVREIALGLHAAHELRGESGQPLGVVHRDVSPDNILLGVHGAVKLIDFGIAKATERLHETRQPTLKGKLRYLAPEQLDGKLDRRTDVFALGIVLWELLTGHRIYDGASDAELLDRVRDPRVAEPSHYVPEVDRHLDRVIAAMTSVSASARPPTTAEAAAMLLDAVPDARHVTPAQIAQLASFVTRAGSGVSDGMEGPWPMGDLGPLTLARQSTQTLATGRFELPRAAPPPGRKAWIAGGAIVTLALAVGLGIALRSTPSPGEIRVRSLAPTPSATPVVPVAPTPMAAAPSAPTHPLILPLSAGDLAAPTTTATSAPTTTATPSYGTPSYGTPSYGTPSAPAGPVTVTSAEPAAAPAEAAPEPRGGRHRPVRRHTAPATPSTPHLSSHVTAPTPHLSTHVAAPTTRPTQRPMPRRTGRAAVVDGTTLSSEL